MQVGFTEDQQQFREVVSRFLSDRSPTTAVRSLMETGAGYDRQVWSELSGQVALVGTHIPERFGGFGFGPIELGLINLEMGRHLYCGPFFASAVMAAYALLNLGDESAQERLLPKVADGGLIATLVLDDIGDLNQAGLSMQVNAQNQLAGTANLVVDAGVADVLLVLAHEWFV